MMDKRWKIGIFRSPKSFSLQLFCHCDFFVIVSPAGGGRGNLKPFCHCEASRKGSRGNLVKKRLVSYILHIMTKKRLPRLNAKAFRLAMTKLSIALLLAAAMQRIGN
jgi:hypothetical protein